jgi:hypothetical protein
VQLTTLLFQPLKSIRSLFFSFLFRPLIVRHVCGALFGNNLCVSQRIKPSFSSLLFLPFLYCFFVFLFFCFFVFLFFCFFVFLFFCFLYFVLLWILLGQWTHQNSLFQELVEFGCGFDVRDLCGSGNGTQSRADHLLVSLHLLFHCSLTHLCLHCCAQCVNELWKTCE